MPSNDYVDRDIKSQMWNNGRSEHTAEAKAFRAAAEHKKKLAKKMKKKRQGCLNCNPSGTQVLGKRDCLTCNGTGYLD